MADLDHIQVCIPRFLPADDYLAAIKAALEENPCNAVHFSHTSAPDSDVPAPAINENVDMGYIVLPEPKLGVFVRKMWSNGRTLRVFFRGGSAFMRNKVMLFANRWSEYANLRFVVVSALPAEIRISFDQGGSWSYVGTDSLLIPVGNPTMNFGWFTDQTSDEEFSRTSIHEFGHAIGCIHEHQQPNASISWNKPVVYEYYYLTQGWSPEQVDSNLFNRYSSVDVSSSAYDPLSIMHYPIPVEFTTNGFSVGWNTRLSPHDINFIWRMYPPARRASAAAAPTITAAAPTITGIFSTLSIRPPEPPALSNPTTIVFVPPSSSPPTILLGLIELDVGNKANLRIDAIVERVATDRAYINLRSSGDTVLYSAGCAWLKTTSDDLDFQFGEFGTEQDHDPESPQAITTRRVDFARRYAAPPSVVLWLNGLDVGNRAGCHVKVYASDVAVDGFTINIESWSDTVLHRAGVVWVAHSAGRADISSGTFGTDDVRPREPPRLENTGRQQFGVQFAHAPHVFMALNTLDIDHTANARILLSASDITATDMSWHLDGWSDTVLYSAGASFIAIDDA